MHLGGNRLWVPLFDESENVLKEQVHIKVCRTNTLILNFTTTLQSMADSNGPPEYTNSIS